MGRSRVTRLTRLTRPTRLTRLGLTSPTSCPKLWRWRWSAGRAASTRRGTSSAVARGRAKTRSMTRSRLQPTQPSLQPTLQPNPQPTPATTTLRPRWWQQVLTSRSRWSGRRRWRACRRSAVGVAEQPTNPRPNPDPNPNPEPNINPNPDPNVRVGCSHRTSGPRACARRVSCARRAWRRRSRGA